jgi:hypothetical protein
VVADQSQHLARRGLELERVAEVLLAARVLHGAGGLCGERLQHRHVVVGERVDHVSEHAHAHRRASGRNGDVHRRPRTDRVGRVTRLRVPVAERRLIVEAKHRTIAQHLCQRRGPIVRPGRSPHTAGPAWYRVIMDASKIWTAEELEKMSPNERQSIVRAGFETDLSKVSPELLERTRRKIEAHIAANQDATTPER